MIGNLRVDDQPAEILRLMRKNHNFKRGLMVDWCIYNTSHKMPAFMVIIMATKCYWKVILSGVENLLFPLLKLLFLIW